MDLHFYEAKGGNFGDDLNAWIWDSIIPGWRDWAADVTLIGVGTLLNEERLSQFREKRILVLGSGVGYGEIPKHPFPKAWDIRAVRGPRSARLLNLESSKAAVDPAVLLSEIGMFQSISKSQETVFVPHASSDSRFDWNVIQGKSDIKIVLPSQDAKHVISEIASAKLVIAESMHAAIIADAFRVPWVGVKISDLFLRDKWMDWAESLELQPEITDLLPTLRKLKYPSRTLQESPRIVRQARHRLEQTFLPKAIASAAKRKPQLSDDTVLMSKKRKLQEILSQTSEDYSKP